MTKLDCPNHEGAYDCTPFCRICEGDQEYTLTDEELSAIISNDIFGAITGRLEK
jgi:hypothetical protein